MFCQTRIWSRLLVGHCSERTWYWPGQFHTRLIIQLCKNVRNFYFFQRYQGISHSMFYRLKLQRINGTETLNSRNHICIHQRTRGEKNAKHHWFQVTVSWMVSSCLDGHFTPGNPFAYPGINITHPFCYLRRKCSFRLILPIFMYWKAFAVGSWHISVRFYVCETTRCGSAALH